MKIKLKYDAKADVPAGFIDLYTEKDGVYTLTGVEGMKTEEDTLRLQQSNVAIRQDLKDAKASLLVLTTALGGAKPEEIAAKLDLVDELQAQVDAHGKGGKPDEAAIERIVETRVKRALAPVERERDGLKKQVVDLTGERDGLSGTLKKGKIDDAVRRVATDLKVLGPAIDDVLLNAGTIFELDEQGKVVTRDNVGVTPGLTPDVWLKDMQEKRPHWWPVSKGGGAGGSGADLKGMAGNPWSGGQAWNMTHQGQFIKEHGIEKANQMAAQAGTKVGGPRPLVKAA